MKWRRQLFQKGIDPARYGERSIVGFWAESLLIGLFVLLLVLVVGWPLVELAM